MPVCSQIREHHLADLSLVSLTVGLASLFGIGSSEVEGAFDPMVGGSDTSVGEGDNQEGYSWKIEPIFIGSRLGIEDLRFTDMV